MERFLDNYNLPSLNQKDKECLNADLSFREIQHTIQILKSGIVAGPDGYPGEFYKEFSDILTLDIMGHQWVILLLIKNVHRCKSRFQATPHLEGSYHNI